MTDQHQTTDCGEHAISLDIRRALSAQDRESCMRIRMDVFVREQSVSPQEEIDGLDDVCVHYIALVGSNPVATARVIPKGRVAKIGRVAVTRAMRRRGIGRELMREVVRDSRAQGFSEAVLDSQTSAVLFYEQLGFVVEGDEFVDAGIPHYRMRCSLSQRDSSP